jgi:hypothetical protein
MPVTISQVVPLTVYPSLPAAIPAGLYEKKFGFLSNQVSGPLASEKEVRSLAKADADSKLVDIKRQISQKPPPSPRIVAAQGPFVVVVDRDWTISPPDSSGNISAFVEFVFIIWSVY